MNITGASGRNYPITEHGMRCAIAGFDRTGGERHDARAVVDASDNPTHPAAAPDRVFTSASPGTASHPQPRSASAALRRPGTGQPFGVRGRGPEGHRSSSGVRPWARTVFTSGYGAEGPRERHAQPAGGVAGSHDRGFGREHPVERRIAGQSPEDRLDSHGDRARGTIAVLPQTLGDR